MAGSYGKLSKLSSSPYSDKLVPKSSSIGLVHSQAEPPIEGHPLLVQEPIPQLAIELPILCQWPKQRVLSSYSGQWNVPNFFCFLRSKNSINHVSILSTCLCIYQTVHCCFFQRFHHRRCYLGWVFSWQPVMLPYFNRFPIAYSPTSTLKDNITTS